MDENYFDVGGIPPDYALPPNVLLEDIANPIQHQHLPSPPSLSHVDKVTDRWRESYLKSKLTEKLLAFQEEEEILIRNGRGRETLFKRRSSEEIFQDALGSPGGFGQDNSSYASPCASPPSFLTRDELLRAVKAEKDARRRQRHTAHPDSQQSQASSEGTSRKSTISNGGLTDSKSTGTTPSTSYCPTPTRVFSVDPTPAIQQVNTKKRSLEDPEDFLPAKRRRIDCHEISTIDMVFPPHVITPLPLPIKKPITPSTIHRSHLPTPSSSEDEGCQSRKTPKRPRKTRSQDKMARISKPKSLPRRRSSRLLRKAPEFNGIG